MNQRKLQIAVASLLWMTACIACPSQAKAEVTTLDNASCVTCHDERKGKLEISGPGREKRALAQIDLHKFGRGIHGEMQCIACHKEIIDATAPHKKSPTTERPNCVTCHEALWESVKKEGLTAEKSQLGLVIQNIAAYKKSLHASPDKDNPSRAKAVCEDCHSSHTFNVPAKGTARRTAWHREIPKVCGEKCHEEQFQTYTASVHGQEVMDKGNLKAAVCTDCHTAHSVSNTSSDAFKLANVDTCGGCHKQQMRSYTDTHHGQVNRLGYTTTARCASCHGSHGIREVNDPKSKVHPNNRMKTCKTCHNGKKDLPEAPDGFKSFQPHGVTDNFQRYPQIWIANQIMIQLLVGTFSFFWLHTLLWFYREYQERRQRRGQPHVKLDHQPMEVPEKLRGKHFQRFSPTWRIAHLTFAVSLMVLTLTGMPLFYSESP